MADNKLIAINTDEQHALPIRLIDYITSPSEASRINETSRISLYEAWLVANNMDGITNFDLAAYKHYLVSQRREQDGLTALSKTSAAAHINSIRARYMYMLDKAPGHLRDYLYSQTPEDASPSDRKAYVDEMQLRIRERVQDRRASVQLVQRTDETDEQFNRLTFDDMLAYCEAPLSVIHHNPIMGVRDAAILTILCMTGIREDELINLDVADVHQSLGGYPALEVRSGKGAKQRVIPYGDFHDFVSERISAWLRKAGISTGPLFRSLTKWGTTRDGRIAKRQINTIVARYPARYRERTVSMKPHDCRRTYARILRYEFDLTLEGIAQNLGHSDIKTTRRYIGEVEADHRVPRHADS